MTDQQQVTPNLDIELGIISAVLDDGKMNLPVQKKIRDQFFMKQENKAVWNFMWEHNVKYKKPPELAAVQREFPSFSPITTGEPIEYFIEQLQIRQKHNMILRGIQMVGQELTGKNVLSAEKLLVELVSKINTEINVTEDTHWNTDVQARKERLERKIQFQGVDGISYGIDQMDNATGGMHEGELITVVAKSGVGKTFFEIACVAQPALKECVDVLFISREMMGWQIEQRTDAIMAEVPSDALKLGRISEEDKQKYFDWLDSLADQPLGRLVVSSDDEGGFGLAALQAKIQQHLPEGGVVIVDGSYLLDDDEAANRNRNNYDKITSITRGLKRMARRLKVTIVQSSQMGRTQKRGKFGDADAISFSSSFEQDSDVVWELYQTEEMKAAGKMGVHGLKIREGDKPTLLLHWNFDTMRDFGKLATDATDFPPDDDDEVIIA
jgi:replicative DNA helicase